MPQCNQTSSIMASMGIGECTGRLDQRVEIRPDAAALVEYEPRIQWRIINNDAINALLDTAVPKLEIIDGQAADRPSSVRHQDVDANKFRSRPERRRALLTGDVRRDDRDCDGCPP